MIQTITRYFRGGRARLLKATGIALYIAGAAISVGLLAAAPKAHRLLKQEEGWLIGGVLVLVFIAALLALYLGQKAFLYGKRLQAQNETHSSATSLRLGRRPVLYLRSFTDEQITSLAPLAHKYRGVIDFQSLSTEEEHLAKAFRGLGPFVAIANPLDKLPQLGAVRIEAGSEDWQKEVLQLLSQAELVVFRIGSGKWLWWEIEQALSRVAPEQLLFLVPNDLKLFEDFRTRLRETKSLEIPDLGYIAIDSVSVVAIVHFDAAGKPLLEPLQDARFRGSISQPLRPMLRIALRPVFENLGVAWTPPPVSVTAHLQVIPSLWVFGLCIYWFVVLFPAVYGFLAEGDGLAILFLLMELALLYGIVKSGVFLWTGVKVLVGGYRQFRPGSWGDRRAMVDPEIIHLLERTRDAWAAGTLDPLGSVFAEETKQSRRKFVGHYLSGYSGALHTLLAGSALHRREFLISVADEDAGILPSDDRAWFVLTQRRLIQRDGADGTVREIDLCDVASVRVEGGWTKRLTVFTKKDGDIHFSKLQTCPKQEALELAIRLSKSADLRLVSREGESVEPRELRTG